MTIDALPTPPSRADDTTTFSAKADALLGALPDFVTQTNALAVEVDGIRDDAESKRAATESLYDDTVLIKDAAEDARDLALTYRDTTNTYRGQAETARDQAQTAAAAAGAAAGLPSLTDNASKVLAVAGTELGVEWVAPSFRLDSFVILDSGTSWTCPDGVVFARVRGVGGCGGGGRGTSIRIFDSGTTGGEFEAVSSLTPGATYAYAIGAGGAAGGWDGSAGSAGGATLITINGVTYSASGGAGGGDPLSQVFAGGVASAPGGIAKKGQPSNSMPEINPERFSVYGPISSLGTEAGSGGRSSGATAGAAGKIVLELYK